MLNNNLKYAREELEMTQTELGYVFGVQKATVSNWENGYDIIPLTKLVKFCNLYHFSIDFILNLNRKNNFKEIPKLDKNEVGRKLKALRKDLKMTQQQIADECNISRATYCHYEIGMNLIITLSLYTICKNHNISIDEFLRN